MPDTLLDGVEPGVAITASDLGMALQVLPHLVEFEGRVSTRAVVALVLVQLTPGVAVHRIAERQRNAFV